MPSLLGTAMKFVKATARVQRHAEPVLAPEHEAVEPGRVDAGHRIARHNLTGRDVGGGIDHKLQRDR